MKKLAWAIALLVGFLPLVMTPAPAHAVLTCACLDTDADEACTVADTFLDDADWLKGPTVGLGGNFPGQTFLLPAGCSITTTLAPKGGVVVNAAKIIIRGTYLSTQNGGEGTQFNATGDILVDQVDPAANRPKIESGGINKLLTGVLANAAVAKSSVALKAGGICRIINADLRGNPVLASGQIGIQCHDEIDIHGSTMVAAGIDIQSLTGAIDATATAGISPPAGIECDVPVAAGGKNQTAGNNNGVLDAGDYPCTITFQAVGGAPFNDQIIEFCEADPPVSPNRFEALNNPLVMIAQLDLKLDSPSAPGNFVGGRFDVFLVSATGRVDLDNAEVVNINQLGGARIYVTASPASVTRIPVLKEKWTGPSAGNIEIDGTCFTSFSDVLYGQGATLVGTPAPPPCKQVPDGFTAILNGAL